MLRAAPRSCTCCTSGRRPAEPRRAAWRAWAWALLGVLACGPLFASAENGDERMRQLAAAAGHAEPLLRIGLAPAHRVELRASGAYRVLDVDTGAPVWRAEHRGTLQVVADGGPDEAPPAVFRVQVGAFATREAATERLAGIERATATAGMVRHDPDRGAWRVRVGEAEDRLALGPLVAALRAAGVADPWIVEEAVDAPAGVRLRLVDRDWRSDTTAARRIAVVAEAGVAVEVDGKPYRGVVELRLGRAGQVRPVNWVEIESYLRGVVPAELGPEVWPQIEALKAQAVAARTYAWRNRGQFADEGFDLCATPRCQVYGGRSAEHPMSDRAVADTRGEILLWQGRPIDALYTATCGGHTEDAREVFAEQDQPYLRGVPCRAEAAALAALRTTLSGPPIEPLRDETGAAITREWSLLEAAGVLSPGARERALAPLTPAELRTMTRALADRCGLRAPAGEAAPIPDLGTAAAALVADMGWAGRVELLLGTADVQGVVRDAPARQLPPEQARALAYLVSVEALRPLADGRFGVERPPSRARVVPVLERIGRAYAAFGLREAVVGGAGPSGIRLLRGTEEERVLPSSAPALFASSGGAVAPVETLDLWPGDRVRYRTDAAGAVDFLELIPPVKGTADDRAAVVWSWEVRRTRAEVDEAIAKHAAVGALVDLEVLRRGVSGRIAELRIVGTDGATVVRGFDVRRILDLKESLAVIEPQRDAAGNVTHVVFAGRGWGHGVGLCQVGAYGMALRGAGYREILSHYYTGAELGGLPPGAP